MCPHARHKQPTSSASACKAQARWAATSHTRPKQPRASHTHAHGSNGCHANTPAQCEAASRRCEQPCKRQPSEPSKPNSQATPRMALKQPQSRLKQPQRHARGSRKLRASGVTHTRLEQPPATPSQALHRQQGEQPGSSTPPGAPAAQARAKHKWGRQPHRPRGPGNHEPRAETCTHTLEQPQAMLAQARAQATYRAAAGATHGSSSHGPRQHGHNEGGEARALARRRHFPRLEQPIATPSQAWHRQHRWRPETPRAAQAATQHASAKRGAPA